MIINRDVREKGYLSKLGDVWLCVFNLILNLHSKVICVVGGVLLTFFTLTIIVFLLMRRVGNIVFTDCGAVEGYEDNGVIYYLGIPYSVRRMGTDRWKPPEGLKEAGQCWKGVLKASQYSKSCPQSGLFEESMSEDCLYLNVYQPSSRENGKRVLVWIHGGGFYSGGAKLEYRTPEIFAREKDIVVVSFNYRLGMEGFLALDELSQADPRGTSGNYGLLDMVRVLEWINENIQHFGGDPTEVTVMGQSAGGNSVLALSVSPKASGLFKRGISLSAVQPWLLFQNYSIASRNNYDILDRNGICKGMKGSALLHCLYEINMKKPKFPAEYSIMWMFGIPPPDVYESKLRDLAIIDGDFLHMSVSEYIDAGISNVESLIVGVMQEENDLSPRAVLSNNSKPFTREEYESFVRETFSGYTKITPDEILALYDYDDFESPQQAYDQMSTDIFFTCGNLEISRRFSAKTETDVFFYLSPQHPSKGRELSPNYITRYAFHMYDSICAFTNTDMFILDEEENEFGKMYRDVVKKFSDDDMDPEWETFSVEEEKIMVLTSQGPGKRIIKNPRIEKCQLWNKEFVLY